jgi:LPS export ABC transporter protein LptC
MIRKPSVLFVFIFVLGVAIGLVVNMQRGSRTVASDTLASNQTDPDVVANDLELVQGTDGKVQWRVRAKNAQYSFDQRIVQVKSPQLFAYVGTDREEVFLRSDLGEINQRGNTITMRDNIIGRYSGFTLTSDVFDYIGAMKKIYLKGRVIVERPDFMLNATAVEINIETKELTAAGGVTAELLPAGLNTLKKEKRP